MQELKKVPSCIGRDARRQRALFFPFQPREADRFPSLPRLRSIPTGFRSHNSENHIELTFMYQYIEHTVPNQFNSD